MLFYKTGRIKSTNVFFFKLRRDWKTYKCVCFVGLAIAFGLYIAFAYNFIVVYILY